MVCINLATWHFQLTAGSWKFFHSEYCNTLVLRSRLILNDKIFSIGIGIVIEFSKLRYWYWYLYWFSKSGVLVLKSVSISEIWNIEIDIGIETWFFRIKYWYWLIRAGIAHLCPMVSQRCPKIQTFLKITNAREVLAGIGPKTI